MASAARSAELGKMSGGKDEDKKRKKK